jgi:hypothetical protein
MAAVLSGRGPLGGERLLKYNIFLTDSFSGNKTSLAEPFYLAPGQPVSVQNDDTYRTSKHLLTARQKALAIKNAAPGAMEETLPTTSETNLREHSLARQLQTKEDRPATIRLIRRLKPEELAQEKSTEPRVPWINLIAPNTKFFLEQVQENREEKVQVIDTFGEWVAFFFGRKPEVYSYAGTLLNAKNHDWKNEFQINYDLFLRGSQAVRYKATVMLQYDDVLVEGYILNSNIQMTAAADKAVPFSFNMLVINRSPINYRSIIGMRIERSGATALEQALFQGLNEALDLTVEGRVDELETFLLMREYFSGHYVPGAGTSIHRPQAGNIEPQTSNPPGQVGGLMNEKPESCPFESKNKNKVDASGTTSEAFEATGVNPTSNVA